jgi:hypothetical protein
MRVGYYEIKVRGYKGRGGLYADGFVIGRA